MRRIFVLGVIVASAATAQSASAADRSAPATATTDRGTWITPGDYPPDALRAGEEGVVIAQFRVSETGAVDQCGVVESSKSPSLDYQTCQLITARAKFEPAKDKKGRPIASTVKQRIRWQLPTGPAVQSAVPYNLRIGR